MLRDYRLFLEDIHQSSEKVLRFTYGMAREEFFLDEKTFDAVIRNLEIIGEAARQVPDRIRQRYPEVDWLKLVGLRNVIAHEYFGLDEDILWDIVQNRMPNLRRQVERILADDE